jgi:hypothetical protein
LRPAKLKKPSQLGGLFIFVSAARKPGRLGRAAAARW